MGEQHNEPVERVEIDWGGDGSFDHPSSDVSAEVARLRLPWASPLSL